MYRITFGLLPKGEGETEWGQDGKGGGREWAKQGRGRVTTAGKVFGAQIYQAS